MKGCFLRMLIQPVVFVAVSCLMCVISIDAAEQKYGSRFYEELAGMDSREIYRHALRVSKNEHTDSAIAYYTVVVNRYSDNLNDSDKMMMAQAMCNLGAMTYYHVQDYNRSYRYLLKGLEVACEVKHERLKPYIYVNLSDIHSLFGDSVMSDRLCRKAFWMGKELKDDYIYKNALLELICKQILYGNFGSIEKELADFGRHGLPEGTPLRDYTYYVYDGVMAYINGDYDKCLSYLDKAGAESQESSRVQPAGIDDKTVQLAGAIKHYMETSGDIYDPDFSLDKLAADVGAHTRNVSRAVNEVFGINFSTMLSNYRVNEACRRLSSPDYANVTIQAIAADVGFKSRSNFIAVFRRQTGMTPNEYKKKSESKSNPD